MTETALAAVTGSARVTVAAKGGGRPLAGQRNRDRRGERTIREHCSALESGTTATREEEHPVAAEPGKRAPRKRPHPHGLAARGGAFWAATTGAYDLSESERQLLREVCRLLDEVESLHAVVKRDGLTTAGASGQTRVHPAIGEVRQHRVTLGRLLAQLALPDPDGEAIPSPAQARARRAAATRWAGHEKRSS